MKNFLLFPSGKPTSTVYSAFFSAPCPPAIISKQYTCGTNIAVFRWTDPVGRLSFLAQVAGEGYQDSCQTTNTSCAFQNLPCGSDLNVTVQAHGVQCNSIPSVSESLQTGNPPSNVVLINKPKSPKWSDFYREPGEKMVLKQLARS